MLAVPLLSRRPVAENAVQIRELLLAVTETVSTVPTVQELE